MAWINVVARHGTNRRVVRDVVANLSMLNSISMLELTARSAVELGDADALQRMTAETHTLYQQYLARALSPKELGSFGRVGGALAASCLFHFAGRDQTETWKAIAALARPEDAATTALLEIVSNLGEPEIKRARARTTKYPRTLGAFVKDVATRPSAELLDVANSPDHPAFESWMQYFNLPLAVKRARELGVDPLVPASQGAFPERRGELVYARSGPRPDAGASGPRGFDAIESKGGELVVHHYLGITWKAPLAFEPGLDAFAFLAFLADDWEEVKGTVSPAIWASIEEKRAAGKCIHVVSYDPSEAGASEKTTNAAGTHYGVTLIAKSLFDL